MVGSSAAAPPSVHEALSFFSWMLILVFLAVEFRHRIHVLGSFIVPLALVSLISAAALPDTVPTLQPMFRTLWLHVTLSMLGTVGFAVAFVAGVMYLIQDRLLKSKRFNVLYVKLPALDFLDHLNQQSITGVRSVSGSYRAIYGVAKGHMVGIERPGPDLVVYFVVPWDV
jgi:ABC-type uncharacterized transport system permease subunit